MAEYSRDDARLRLLATGRDEHWRTLYDEMRSPFRLFFLKYTQAADEEVLALYQDTLVVLHRKVVDGRLAPPLQSSLKTYLFGVGKMLHRKQLGARVQWQDDIPEVPVEAEAETQAERREKAELVRRLLNMMDEACREMLELVYLQNYAMEAIAESMQLPSAGAARKRKYDCLQRMRKLLTTA